MKKLALFVMTFVFAIIATACGTEDAGSANVEEGREITVEHRLGETTLTTNPETVVVFDMGVVDTMDQLGIEIAGLPKSSIPSHLEHFASDEFANVGTLHEPDFEKLAEVAPDLIIISGRAQEAYDELSEIAPTVFLAVDTARYMESFKENVTIIGEIFEMEEEVAEKLTAIEEQVAALYEEVTAAERNTLVVLTNNGNVNAFGPGSRFGLIHEDFGFIPVDEDLDISTRHGQSISFEYIVEKNPEYLFVIDRGAVVSGGEAASAADFENELVQKTDAYKNGNIVYLDPVMWYIAGGGLQSVQSMIEEVQAAIQ